MVAGQKHRCALLEQRSYGAPHAAATRATRRYVPILARVKLVNFDRPGKLDWGSEQNWGATRQDKTKYKT